MIDVQDIRTTARELLEKGEVRAVVGFRRGTRGMQAEPVVLTEAEGADELVWDPTCVHNLALYLVEDRKYLAHIHQHRDLPVAVVAKGCDARAVSVLLQENYFPRDKVHVIGVSCEGTGVLDERKLARKLDGKVATEAAFDGDDFVLTVDGAEKRMPATEVMAERCLECRNPYPKLHDVAFGEDKTEREIAPAFAALARFEEANAGPARWDFWKRQFERCIRCFACRSVCPMCYCEECVVDSITMAVTPETTAEEKAHRIRWIERSATRSENIGYHMTRAMHLAGRCVDCAECERVCPVNIPLRLLNTKLEREAYQQFEYVAGADLDGPSLTSSFRDDDPNDFIR